MSSTTYAHYTAHSRPGTMPLIVAERLAWLWVRLSMAFPDALAAILMPDHLHFIARVARAGRRRLAAILGAFARYFGLGELWMPVPEPEPLVSRDKVVRGVRYVWLNCCRSWRRIQLVRDPLLWPWSTLRDVVGAVVEPWTSSERLGVALDWRARDVAESLHAYASRDSTVAVDGTPFPRSAPPTVQPSSSLADIAEAALACTRSVGDAIRTRGPARTVFAALAYRQGWRQPSLVADACGVTTRTVPRLVKACPAEWLEAAALCLGDPRLRSMDARVPAMRDAVPAGRW